MNELSIKINFKTAKTKKLIRSKQTKLSSLYIPLNRVFEKAEICFIPMSLTQTEQKEMIKKKNRKNENHA